MKELLAHAKVHFSNRDSTQEWPKTSLAVDTIYGEYGVDIYNPLPSPGGPPLVVELGLGRRKDSALAKKIVEKLVDPSRSTFVFQAARQPYALEASLAGQLAAMHKLGIEEYDAVGMSFGGYETIARARAAGTRALHIVTFAAIGELTGGPRAYGRAIPGMLRSGAPELSVHGAAKLGRLAHAIGENGAWLAGCVARPHNTLAQLAIICQANLFEAVGKLPMSTHLTMVVGGLDSVAGPAGADRAVQIHAERAGRGMAQRILVREVSHSLTAESETVGHITSAVLRGEAVDAEIDLIKPRGRIRQAVVAASAFMGGPYEEPGLAMAG